LLKFFFEFRNVYIKIQKLSISFTAEYLRLEFVNI
jgi:hypothetical protein